MGWGPEMAGDWIKMRGALLNHPKVIVIGRKLHETREFRDWLTPGGGGPSNGQIVSNAALRCVTVSLLMSVWSTLRMTGTFVENDLYLEHSEVEDLDQISGVKGFGEAMLAVGWVVEEEAGNGIFFPNFKEFNVPLTPAEKQESYRKRLRTSGNGALPDSGNKKVTEKRREEGNYVGVLVELPSTPTNPTSPKEKQAGGPKRANGYSAEARELLAFLNEKTGKNFREVGENLRLIDARLASGVPVIRCRQVILRKWREWKDREEMHKYLRPATLFSPTNFEQYLGEIPADAPAPSLLDRFEAAGGPGP